MAKLLRNEAPSLTDAVFEQAPHAMFVAQMDGEIVAVNKAMRGLLRQADTKQGLSLPTLLEKPDEVLDVLQLLHDGGRFENLDLSFRCLDGSTQTLRLSASTLSGDHAGQRCFLGTALNPNGHLYQTSRTQAVERLAAAVAHDLNNVLSAVVGYCHLLREPLLTNRAALQDLMAIEQSSERAAAVVRQLLVFGQERRLEPQLLDVGDQINMLEPILRRVLPAGTALVVGQIEQTAILIDQSTFNEILLLLLSARASGTDGGSVQIEASRSTDGHMILDITDNALELDTVAIEKCVDELFASPESAGGYSGLGLAAVRVLVARSGGTIKVLDTPNAGTTFRISFPTIDVDSETSESADLMDTPAPAAGTIMLVEDDPSLREIARRVLSDEGYVVVEARSGEEALTIADEKGRSFDVLVTDMMMPGIKGWEVARAVKVTHPRCAMIYVSGYVDSARLRQELPDDAVFLGKPFTPPRLLEAVAAVVARRGRQQGP
jgi:two-component system cell cycle sensor histidine kinase/response regulator CckA